MADDSKKSVRLAPQGPFRDSYTLGGGPDEGLVIEQSGTDVPEDKAEQVMEQAASEGAPLRVLEDEE